MKTRSKPQIAARTSTRDVTQTTTESPPSLPARVDQPPKPFILPDDISADARIVTLTNPATDASNRYLYCPKHGFHEFIRIAAPRRTPRSWLYAPKDGTYKGKNAPHGNDIEQRREMFADGYITQDPGISIATPIDALFLILPAIAPASAARIQSKAMFLSLDDHLDKLEETSKHMKSIIRDERARSLLQNRLGAVCDSVDAGVEQMYRLSNEKLAQELLTKAQRMTANGLPASMEEKFVRAALQAPVLSVQRLNETERTEVATENQQNTGGACTPSDATNDSPQTAGSTSSLETAATSMTPICADITVESVKADIEISDTIQSLLRVRTAFQFILSSYVPCHLHATLQEALAAQRTIDFTPLDSHLVRLAQLRAEAVAQRSLSDNINHKRGLDDDEEADLRAEKRRKTEEEEKKKKSESRAMKELKKVNTKGMQKLSAFFSKASTQK